MITDKPNGRVKRGSESFSRENIVLSTKLIKKFRAQGFRVEIKTKDKSRSPALRDKLREDPEPKP